MKKYSLLVIILLSGCFSGSFIPVEKKEISPNRKIFKKQRIKVIDYINQIGSLKIDKASNLASLGNKLDVSMINLIRMINIKTIISKLESKRKLIIKNILNRLNNKQIINLKLLNNLKLYLFDSSVWTGKYLRKTKIKRFIRNDFTIPKSTSNDYYVDPNYKPGQTRPHSDLK